jgi:FkbM family methyltransferase
MIKRIKNSIIGRVKNLFSKPYYKTYSQSGEDLILETALAAMRINKPRYLDIGANDPIKLSNTYLFYKQGGSGVLIEPNQMLAERLAMKRPKDKVRVCGVGPEPNPKAKFYVLSAHTASTFSKHDADLACATGGIRLIDTKEVPILTLERIVSEEFEGGTFDLLSLDVEGLDEAIVLSTDWTKIRPSLICVETREFSPDYSGKRAVPILERLIDSGYGLFGQTFCNSIFADRTLLPNP